MPRSVGEARSRVASFLSSGERARRDQKAFVTPSLPSMPRRSSRSGPQARLCQRTLEARPHSGHHDRMALDPKDLVRDFADWADRASITGWSGWLRGHLYVELLAAPHERPRRLPEGFAHRVRLRCQCEGGASAPCGAGCVLKVGRVGASNNQGFQILPLPGQWPKVNAGKKSCKLPHHLAVAGN